MRSRLAVRRHGLPRPTLSSWTCFCALLRSSRWIGPTSPALKLNGRFLSGPNSRPERRKLPFFGDLHQEISRSWKQPFSSHLTNAAAADFTNLVGSVEQGYTAMPVVEDTLASHLSPSLAPSHKVTLRPRPGYIPKVLSTSFRSQVVTLHSFHPPPFVSSEDEKLHMLCPVRALKLYVDHSKVWRKSSQLLVCFFAGCRGLATSKQRISHWVRDAISLAYEARNLPSPLSLRAHSTRGVASSQALFRGVPLEDICVVAGWSSPHTFVRFCNLDIDTAPGSQILSV